MSETKTRKATVIIPNLKAGIKDFITSSGSVKDIRDVSILQYNVGDEQLSLCVEITNLLINSRLLNDTIKLYLKSNYNNIKRFVNEYNDLQELNGKKKISYGGVQSNIYLAEKKLEKIFSMDDPYLFILRYNIRKNNPSYIKEYNELKSSISRLNQVYTNEENKIYSQMLISLDREAFNSELSDADFDEFLANIKWYSKKVRDNIQSLISTEEAGYFNYLMYSKSLTETDKIRKTIIENLFLYPEFIEDDDIEIEE